MTSCVVIALYPYKYELGDGKEVSFDSGEQFVLLSKTNADWWHVQRDGEKPIYVPASYVREIEDDNSISSSGEIFPSFTRSDSKNLDEECERREYSPEIVTQPVVSVFDEETYNSDYNSERLELSPRPKSIASISGVREMAKTLEMTGLPVRGGSLSLPTAPRSKSQSLPPGWVGTKDEKSGRMYYFNTSTNESSWKPPRQQRSRTAPSWVQSPTLGWYISDNSPLDELVYVNDYNNEQWQLSTDEQGRVFYYQVNGTATAWELPEVEPATRQSFEALDVTYRRRSPNLSQRTSKVQSLTRSQPCPPPEVDLTWSTLPPPPPALLRDHERTESVQSTDSLSSGGADEWPAPPSPASVSSMSVERQGILNRKKLTESGGKKAKKSSWTSTFVMLLSSNMVFYKDQKAAASKPGHPHGRPESSCELQGAALEWLTSGGGSSKKRKNVFQIKTISSMTFLLQCDNSNEATGWFDAIAVIIRKLNDENSAIIGTVQEKGQTALSGYESDDALEEPTTPAPVSPVPQLTRSWSRKAPTKPIVYNTYPCKKTHE